MSKWDWLHAGLEVATYAKAHQAKRDLDEMKTAAQMEAARRHVLEAMRNLIFDVSRDIQLAEEQLTEHPQQVYIVARSLERRFVNSKLSPEAFPEFADKQYVLETEKTIARVVEEARARLTTEHIEQSDTATEYIADMPMLEKAISAKSAKESLKATDQQWEEVSSRHSRRTAFTWLAVVGLVLSACMGLPLIAWGFSQITEGGLDGSLGGMLTLAVGSVFPGAAIALFALRGAPDPDYKPLELNRQSWRARLMRQRDWHEVVSTFGDLSSSEFEAIRQERLAFLKRVLGGGFQEYLISGT